MAEQPFRDASLVPFGAKLAASPAFSGLFRDGMTLVEETAAYLDGAGRVESKRLRRQAALTYATESMRLTTRLMQLASWLLLHRAFARPWYRARIVLPASALIALTGAWWAIQRSFG